MNQLQKNHKKDLKRQAKRNIRKSLENPKKTGRLKVSKRLYKEHQKKLLAEKLKPLVSTSVDAQVVSAISSYETKD
jgi:hypothetical protein